MADFKFNKIYVIESLDSKVDRLTGEELYEDLLKWKEEEFKGDLKTELIQIRNKDEFFNRLEYIYQECAQLKYYPILHLEIHGAKEKTGLILGSGELIGWEELYMLLTKINSHIGNNLFLTLAVCHGAYLMEVIKINKPAPFLGFIGSFQEIYESDLYIRYNEFYQEFLSTFNLKIAFERLTKVNPKIPSSYRIISSEDVFKEVYNKYYTEKTSEEGIKKTIDKAVLDKRLDFTNRALKRKFEIKFKKLLHKTKNQSYKEHSSIFFMFENFPENKKRFNIGGNLKK